MANGKNLKPAANSALPLDRRTVLGGAAATAVATGLPGAGPARAQPIETKAAVYADLEYMKAFNALYEDSRETLRQAIKDELARQLGRPAQRTDLKWGLYQQVIQPRDKWHPDPNTSGIMHDNWPNWSGEARESLERLPAGFIYPAQAWNPYNTSEVADNLQDHLDKAIRVALWDDHPNRGRDRGKIVPIGVVVDHRKNPKKRHRHHGFGTLWETEQPLVPGLNPNAVLKRLILVMVCPSNGWEGYAWWRNRAPSKHITRFSATWVVPEKPRDKKDQILFMFNCLESMHSKIQLGGILQPVLQWDAVSENWYIRNWYVRSDFNPEDHSDLPNPNASVAYGSQTYQEQGRCYSTAILVTPGQTITGLIQRVAGPRFNYVSSVNGNGQSVTLGVNDVPELVYAACAVESYGVNRKNREREYPASPSPLLIENIDLRVDGTSIRVPWTESEKVGKDFMVNANSDRIRFKVKP